MCIDNELCNPINFFIKTTVIKKRILAHEKQTPEFFFECNNQSFRIMLLVSFEKGLINPK